MEITQTVTNKWEIFREIWIQPKMSMTTGQQALLVAPYQTQGQFDLHIIILKIVLHVHQTV